MNRFIRPRPTPRQNYYGDGFDDCLKQVRFVYLNLDLSKITLDDVVLMTLGGDDTVSEEPDDSAHTVEQDPKDNDLVIAQPVLESPITPVVSSVEVPSDQNIVNPTAVDAPPS